MRLLLVGTLLASLATPAFADRVDARRPSEMPVTSVSRDAVRTKLAAQRAANIARFHAYRTAGVYPSNIYTPGALNVWRDDDGHLCAAATIIDASGAHDLVQETSVANNFIRLADVTEGPLMDWIITSGLTQAELVTIQRPFMGVADPGSPQRPIVDARKKLAETARLAAKYKAIEAAIAKATKASLDRATDRLMANPVLARAFLQGERVAQVDTPVIHRYPSTPVANHRFAQPPR